MKAKTISFNDLLDDAVELDGLSFEARIRATVRKCDDGSFEIEYFDMDDVYIRNGSISLIKLDQESLKTRNRLLYARFVNSCELLALQKARLAPEHEYDDVEEYAV